MLGFNVGRNTGLFLKDGEDSIAAEITYGRFRGLAGQQQFDKQQAELFTRCRKNQHCKAFFVLPQICNRSSSKTA